MKYLLPILAMMILGMLPATAIAQCLSTYTISPEMVESEPVIFRADDINLRAGPGTRYCKVRVLDQGKDKPATIVAQVGSWRQIRFENRAYWIHFMLLKIPKL